MKKIFLSFLVILLMNFALAGCTRGKCWDDANATITGYDQTKGMCGTGFIIKVHAQKSVPEKDYIVRELTGKYAEQIKMGSKFPIKIRYQDKLTPIENCPNVIATLEVFEPTPFCPK